MILYIPLGESASSHSFNMYDLKTLPNTQKIKGNFLFENNVIRWNSLVDDSVRGAATACVIYQVREAN